MPLTDLRKRRFLWLGLAAVLIPLGVLLFFQYRWLVELEEASAIARRATLDHFLDAVTYSSEASLRQLGDDSLSLPGWLFIEQRLDKVPHYFKKKVGSRSEKATDFFVVSFVEQGDLKNRVLFYNGEELTLEPRKWGPKIQAAHVAVTPWKVLAYEKAKVDSSLVVDERDPEFPILLHPVTDDESRVVGVVGAVLDMGYVRREHLPYLVGKIQPKFFPDAGREGDTDRELVVWVRTRDGELVYATHDAVPQPLTGKLGKRRWPGEGEWQGEWEGDRAGEIAERPFTFAFTDWYAGIASRQATTGQWARSNFELNVALSGILGLVLLGGVVLALMSASRAMKLSQMKSDFVSNVSHELRTPLASIRVFGELLRLGKVESGERSREKVREYGEYIETESRRLTQLINNLLDFSSIESGRKSYRFEAVDLEEVVTETLETFTVRLRQRGFRLTYDGPDRPLPPVVIDAGAVAQSLSNLVDNAVKFSNGATEILVSLKRENGSVTLAVQDWGVGIPRDEQEKIFERFHRVSTGLVHDVKGSGLGLSIVQHIVQAHGGKITVESRPGHGSVFTLHLPLEAERRGASIGPLLEEKPA